MVAVEAFCIDRWEASMVDRLTGEALSPYYPPSPRLFAETWVAWQRRKDLVGDEAARRMPIPDVSEWQKTHSFDAKAMSRSGVVPQAYVTHPIAVRGCENAGKRICTLVEWTTACRSQDRTTYSYGNVFDRSTCNVYRYVHPGFLLHGDSSVGLRDPRMNLVTVEGERPLLEVTGSRPRCASRWGADAVRDLVGNLDEWVETDEGPAFVGGFYARSTTKGCDAIVSTHAPVYSDYSIGARCCTTP